MSSIGVLMPFICVSQLVMLLTADLFVRSVLTLRVTLLALGAPQRSLPSSFEMALIRVVLPAPEAPAHTKVLLCRFRVRSDRRRCSCEAVVSSSFTICKKQ